VNHQEAVEVLAQIEQQFNVNTVRYKGLKIWPLVRLALWTKFQHPESDITRTPSLRTHSGKATSFSKIAVPYINMVRIHQKQLEALSSVAPIDIVFFSRLEDHADCFDDRFYNRHVDPMTDLVKNRYSYVKLELSGNPISKCPRFEPTVFIDPTYFLTKESLLEGTHQSNQLEKIVEFGSLRKVVFNLSGGVAINESYFIFQARSIEKYQALFTNILESLRPKAVFLVCYYYTIAMALVRACKALGITTVDIQHGKQGKYHGLYTHWTKIPEDGYELLPDIFWVWGQESQNNIQKWHPAGCQHHKPSIGGNRWLAKWANGNGLKLDQGAESFLERLDDFDRVILVSLQPLERPLPNHLLEAMQQSPKRWFWLLRLHPLYKHQKTQVCALMNQLGIRNFEVDSATNLPLYALLQKSNHHLTVYSSVCYEALVFGVPTTILGNSGLRLYDDYIREGFFNYADTADALLAFIHKTHPPEQLKESIPYIETSQQAAESALSVVLGKSW
jgi:hypothetical protein